MIEPLGHTELAHALRGLTRQTFPRPLRDAAARARGALESAPVEQVQKTFPLGGLSLVQSQTLDTVAARLQATLMQVALAWLLPPDAVAALDGMTDAAPRHMSGQA